MKLNEVTERVIGAAIEVHRAVGRGFSSPPTRPAWCTSYWSAGCPSSGRRRFRSPTEVHIRCGYRIDFLVEREVIVELKAVAQLEPIHEAQLLSYLKLSGCPVGLLINFNVKQLRNGVRRLVNGLDEGPP